MSLWEVFLYFRLFSYTSLKSRRSWIGFSKGWIAGLYSLSTPTTSPQLWPAVLLHGSHFLTQFELFLFIPCLLGDQRVTHSQSVVNGFECQDCCCPISRRFLERRHKLFGYHWFHPGPSIFDDRTRHHLFPPSSYHVIFSLWSKAPTSQGSKLYLIEATDPVHWSP